MIDILSGVLGGALRLAPEILNYLDRKDKRKHEITLADKGIISEEVKSLGIALQAQMQLTGHSFIDMLNFGVRPVLTYYWCIFLYTAYLVAAFITLKGEGVNNTGAILQLFGDTERGIVWMIISFWFVDRAVRYTKG